MARSDYEHLSREQLLDVIERLEARVAQLEAHVARLERLLDDATRGGKRQAAPFSKGPPRPDPRKPGRKPGDAHGRHVHRAVPATPPDEVIAVPALKTCPHCAGPVDEETVVHQHQMEIPRRPIHRRFDIHVGRCRSCGRRLQPRHPLQTSDAIGAAASQLGPDAQTAVALMKNRYGLSYGDVVGLFQDVFGIPLSPGGAARAVQRAAARSESVYEHLTAIVRHGDGVDPDETGWKVGGRLHWLWDFVSDLATVYVIRPSRGRDVLDEVLGRDYAGRMTHDGWAPYDALTRATHQQCLAHLLRRARESLERLSGRARDFPAAVKQLLQDALALRDRWNAAARERSNPALRDRWNAAGRERSNPALRDRCHAAARDPRNAVRRDRRPTAALSPHGFAVARGRLESRLDHLLARAPRNPVNRRFFDHLLRHRFELLPFLYDHQLQATNWRAEQAIRPAVVNRKVCGGNRTPAGAHALEVLASLFATCRQHAIQALDYLSALLCRPTALDPLTIPLPLPP